MHSNSVTCRHTVLTNQCPHAYFTKSVAEVVKTLASGVSAGKCSMVIRRGHVLEDALKQARKASFDPSMNVEVSTLSNRAIVCVNNLFLDTCRMRSVN